MVKNVAQDFNSKRYGTELRAMIKEVTQSLDKKIILHLLLK